MQLHTPYQFSFKKGQDVFLVEYFLTTELVNHHPPIPGDLWLVVLIEGADPLRFYLSKPLSILRQPKEVVEIIVKRESLHHMECRRLKMLATDL